MTARNGSHKARSSIKVLVAMVFVLAFAACTEGGISDTTEGGDEPGEDSPTTTEDASSDGDRTLRYRFTADHAGPRLDIGKTYTILGPNLFAGLTRLDPQNNVIPGAAEEWEVSDDALTYTFHLRHDMAWSDGEPLTAHDFVYGWLRALNPETQSLRAFMLDSIVGATDYYTGEGTREGVGIQALDDYTMQVDLQQPAAFFPAFIAANNVFFAQPRHVIEEHGDEWIDLENLVYSGPFMITDYSPNSLIVMEPNPEWSLGRGNVERVEMHIVPDASTALAMFENGELDFTIDIPIGEIDVVRDDSELSDQYHVVPSAQIRYFSMNVDVEPFDDVRVRQAFLHAIDQQALTEGPFRGIFQPGFALRPSTMPGADIAYLDGAFNPERAQELLDEAGYPGGEGFPEVSIHVSTDETNVTAAQYLQQQFQSVLGVTLEVDARESQAWSDVVQTGRGDTYIANAFSLSPDFFDLFGIIRSHAEVNSNFVDPEFDEMLEQAAIEGDADERQVMYDAAERLLVEEHAVMVPLWIPDSPSLINDRASAIADDQRAYWSHSWEFLDLR